MAEELDFNIQDGLIIKNEFYNFYYEELEKKIATKYKIRLLVPTNFSEMPYTFKLLKFPSHPRPEYIISNKNFRLCMTFSEIDFSEEWNLQEHIDMVQKNMKFVNPAFEFNKLQTVLSLQYEAVKQCFKSVALDGEVYSINVFIRIKKRLLVIGFICPFRIKDDWENIFDKMIDSIEIE